MGWVTLTDPKTGKTTFLGESPVELPPSLPESDPLHGMREAARRKKFRDAIHGRDNLGYRE